MRDIAIAAAATSTAIASLYVWKRSRLAFSRAICDVVAEARVCSSQPMYFDRDSSSEIAKRTISLTTSAVALAWAVGFPSALLGPGDMRSTGHMTAIIAALWIGPIVESPHSFIIQRIACRLKSLCDHPMRALRELVVAPVAEELIFRHSLLTILSARSLQSRICISALFFAAAHLHLMPNNAVEACRGELVLLQHPTKDIDEMQRIEIATESWAAAKRQTGSQVIMVFLYGLLCGWVFERCCNRSITAAVVGHSLCNFTGAPSFLFLKRTTNWSRTRRILSGAAHIAGVAGAVALAWA